MKKIRETKFKEKTRAHTSIKLPDNLVRFSYKYLNLCEKFYLRPCHKYNIALHERLKSISQMTITEFMLSDSKSLRSHSHDWSKTTEPDGYSHLNEHLKQCLPWQFSLSTSEYGRVHGIILDEIFYIVWFDPDHKLYS